MNLNYLFPLIGAIIPSLLQSKKTVISKNLEEDYFGRFTLNFLYAIIVLLISCLTIHADILNKVIYLGVFSSNHSASSEMKITLVHYIVMTGLGVPLLLLLFFNSFIEAYKIKVLTLSKVAVYFSISSILIFISLNILFVNYFFNLK